VSSVAEARRVSEAEATDEAAAAEVEAPAPIEATMAGAGAHGTTEAQEVEMEAAEASVAPLVQGPPLLPGSTWEVEVLPISSDDVSRAWEMADGEVVGAVEQPVPTPGEGSSALARVRPEPHRWDHPRVLWQSQDDPEVEPLFALKDAAEGGHWHTFEQYRQLVERSLRTALSVVANDLPGVAQVRAFFFTRGGLFLSFLCRD